MLSGVGSRTLLAYTEAGAGPPILMVHGLLSDARVWAPVAELLKPSYRVIRCDLRGHGRTPRRAPGEQRDHPADLLELMSALHLPAVHLVGHGAGAATAAALAASDPGRVLTLTVVDPVTRRAETASAVQDAWHMESLLRWLETGHGAQVRRPEHVAALQRIVSQQTLGQLAPPMETSAATREGCSGEEKGRPTALHCPVLVLMGADEPPETVAMAEAMYGTAPAVQTVRVQGAVRHLPVLAAVAVVHHLTEFLGH